MDMQTIKRILKPMGLFIGGLVVIAGYISLAKEIMSVGLPIWAWQAIGAAIFFVSVIAILHGHQKTITQLTKQKEPFKYDDELTGHKIALQLSPYYYKLLVDDRVYYFNTKTGEFDGASIPMEVEDKES